MNRIWYKNYPKIIPQEIDLTQCESIVSVFETSVSQFSEKPAFSNMGVTLTFNELNEKVDQFASFLQNELRLKKGDRIAIQLPNLLQYPIAAFAALKLGLIIVNTNPLYTPHEMEHQFKDSGAVSIIILANYAAHLEKIIKNTAIQSVVITEIGDLFPLPKKILVNSVVKYVKKMVPAFHIPNAYTFNQALDIGKENKFIKASVNLDDIAFLQYTGGTTGVSKGAVLTHKNIVANMLQIDAWMLPKLKMGQEIAIAALPLYHIFSLTVNCLAFLKYGAHNVLITNPRDFSSFIKDLQKYPFTLLTGVNTLFNALMNHADFQKIDFSHLKVSVAGAMALQKTVSQKWMELTKSVIVEGYGLTEASPVVCCNPIDGTDRVGTIGLPLPSTDIEIRNDEGVALGLGEAGELCVKGPQVMKEYWNRPDETEKVLSKGWLLTGDIAT
ncbi:MAG TPA: AMP-binding protein, partial [Pseudobdellovibrionaceae bacterium]|nr:AMP-binding protein [Pseudobdellovibrionaceae bacterium]